MVRKGAKYSNFFFFSFPRLKCEVSLNQINSKVLKSGQLVSMSWSFRCLVSFWVQDTKELLCSYVDSLKVVFQTIAF